MSKAIADVSERERSVQADQAEIGGLQELLDGLPQFAEDTSLDVDTRHRLVEAQQALRDAELRHTQTAKELQAAKRARELREPEYQRAVAAEGESERLLDAIQSHVEGDSCPLCGSTFESMESLLTSIRLRRESRSPYTEVTAAYQRLVSDESKSKDRLRIASATVTLAKTAGEELSLIQRVTDQRYRTFAVVSRPLGSSTVRTRISCARHFAGATKHFASGYPASASRAEPARRDVATLEKSQADERSRRQGVQDRVAGLDRKIQEFAGRTKAWTAQIEQVLPGSHDVESTLVTESARVEKSIVVLDATLRHMQAARTRNSEVVQVFSAQKQKLSQQRSVLIATLNSLNSLLTTFARSYARSSVQ